MGCGVQKGAGEKYRGVEMDVTVLPKVKVEVIVGSISVEKVIDTVKRTLTLGMSEMERSLFTMYRKL